MPRTDRRFSFLVPFALFAFAPLASFAQTATFNLPVQPLAESLKAVGAQTGLNIMVSPPLVDGKQAPALKASLSAKDALARLLAGTSLEYHFVNDQTVVIRERSQPVVVNDPPATQPGDVPARDTTKEAGKNSSQDFRVAQLDQANAGPQSVEEKKEKQKEFLQEVVVTGSRIPTVAGQQTMPVRIYTQQDIENSGQSTIGDYLNELPSVSTFQNSAFDTGFPGLQTVQLHGLPVGTTLTLLDGQRLETSTLGFFDLSNIPLAAVERIEVLPVGASAIYGADALAGAVNLVLRKSFDGLEVNARLERAPSVDNPSAGLAWGKTWDRAAVSLIANFQDQGELLGSQRQPLSSTQYPGNPAYLSFQATSGCAPGNVSSVDGGNLPGLSAPIAGIPAGISGVPTIGQFARTAGKPNVCNPFRYADITPDAQREGALFSGHYDVADDVSLFTQILYSHRNLRYQGGPEISVSQQFGPIAATNPYNPFGAPVNVDFGYPGSGRVYRQSASLTRPLIGIRGALVADWHYEVTAYLSRDRLSNVTPFDNVQAILAALASADPATALNPFASGAPGTPQLLNSLSNPAGATFDETDQITSGQGLLRGPLGHLPAGDIQGVIGGEYRRERQDNNSAFQGVPSPEEVLERTAYATFAEGRVPLLADKASPHGERLALTLAGRYDHSNDYGGKATWQGGLLWRATESLSLSSGYGTSYQAPQLLQISSPTSSASFPLFGVIDPFRGNMPVDYSVLQVGGANQNLKPQTGDSFNVALEYSPQAHSGLHASLDWYDTRISNYIGLPQVQTLISNPGLYPGAVTRAPPTPQDQQLGYLGLITQVFETFYNFGDLNVAGFDADIRYALDTPVGQITPSVDIANVYKWQSALVPGAPIIDGVSKAVSIFSDVGWAPRWKGTASLAWTRAPLTVNVAGRYVGRYLDYQDLPNSNEIGNTWIFDASGRYEVGQGLTGEKHWLRGSYVALGAVNIFNKIPPFSYSAPWYDYHEYDARGRYVYVNVGLRF